MGWWSDLWNGKKCPPTWNCRVHKYVNLETKYYRKTGIILAGMDPEEIGTYDYKRRGNYTK